MILFIYVRNDIHITRLVRVNFFTCLFLNFKFVCWIFVKTLVKLLISNYIIIHLALCHREFFNFNLIFFNGVSNLVAIYNILTVIIFSLKRYILWSAHNRMNIIFFSLRILNFCVVFYESLSNTIIFTTSIFVFDIAFKFWVLERLFTRFLYFP